MRGEAAPLIRGLQLSKPHRLQGILFGPGPGAEFVLSGQARYHRLRGWLSLLQRFLFRQSCRAFGQTFPNVLTNPEIVNSLAVHGHFRLDVLPLPSQPGVFTARPAMGLSYQLTE